MVKTRPVFLLAILFIFGVADPWPAMAKTMAGKVLKVFDGDTLLIRVEGREEHVRLREIDAPEVAHRRQVGQ
ncbi:MAG: thermonuclease family protein, partial [Deltaproteobacteria bacterium]|nr:thermonuclease family protein [Deltaproteobacteria bacterium]